MTTSEASPREAAATATAAAVEWLARQLHDGPRYSAQLRREAVEAGLQIPALHRAANELGVVRLQASRWSRWSLGAHAEASAEKRCPVCGEIKDREEFRRPPAPSYPAGRMMPVCNPCSDGRSCRTDKRRPDASPNLTEALIDRTASHAPDPAPARTLRCELARQRAMGRPWASAWPYALHQATDGLPAKEASSWRFAFAATSAAWASSYHRHAAVAAHGGLAALAEAA